MTQAAVTFQNCYYQIEDTKILKNITGEVKAGKITTFIGPSGSGKTSLFRLINSLSSKTSGEIFINGIETNEIDPISLRKKVGIVFQEAIMMNGTVFDNLKLASELHNTEFTREDALELLDKVGLENRFLDQLAKGLSSGQKQKVSIARTLANKPDILLLDEITASLDKVSAQDIEDLIDSLNKEEALTILWITHNIEQADKMGNDTWVLIDGEVAYRGPTEQINAAGDERVIRFIEGRH